MLVIGTGGLTICLTEVLTEPFDGRTLEGVPRAWNHPWVGPWACGRGDWLVQRLSGDSSSSRSRTSERSTRRVLANSQTSTLSIVA